MNSGIYKITNVTNDQIYIGSTVNFNKRKREHFSSLNENKHCNKYLQRSFNKHGEENFKFEILEVIEDKNKLIEREQHYLDTLKPQFNICKIAGSQLGYRHSIETKKHLSSIRLQKSELDQLNIWNKGLKLPPRLEIIKIKISQSLKGIERKTFTIEHKQKISRARKGFIPLQESVVKGIITRRKNPKYKEQVSKRIEAATKAKMKKVFKINYSTNEIVEEFPSLKDVISSLNIKGYRCLNKALKNNKIYHGFLWSN